MKVRKLGDWKPKVLIFQGSPRDPDTCSDMKSKTHKIVDYVISKWSPFIDMQVIDLSVNHSKKPIIQPYKKPDLLSELDVYNKLKECDAFVIFSPIHWHSLSSQVKTLFDRLVCINQTLTVDDARKLMGKGNIKDSEITGKFARSGKYDGMLRNHLEGKVAAFYAQGDNGADDYKGKELPESYSDVLDDGFGGNPKSIVMPFVMQLKYSGVFVPDELIESFYVNEGVNYNVANKTFNKNKEFFDRADHLMDNLLTYLEEK